ncbi:aldo/keto reductase family oxidoreductase [Pelomonas sp. KK5]|uniref:aldo/keto reductase n=1 Tax=Pelomonas sp. KK5 TaxID=1855730 RepID=UPI00117DD5E9|nr:aldo/keto reductase [Pelomonas sp. KK5]
MSMTLSNIVAGCWRMAEWGWTPAQRLAWIEACIERGATSFDHADIYGGYAVEALFGEALALKPALREQMQLVSKCGIKLVSDARPAHRIKSYDCSREHIIASVENSLKVLRTDRLDLLLLHRPDALLDADEVAEAFDMLRRAGKVLSFGVSNYTPSQFELLNAATPLVTNQIELHPLERAPLHDGTLDQAQRLKARPMIWSPLAGGRLFTDTGAAATRVREALQAAAEAKGLTSVATAAYAWLLRHPSRPIPIVGSQRLAALDDALAALDWRMDAETWWGIWQAGAGHEVA